jgi:hypothetical protein
VFNGFRWVVVFGFVNIDWILDHNSSTIFFIMVIYIYRLIYSPKNIEHMVIGFTHLKPLNTWQLDLQLLKQSVPITTKVVSLNPAHGKVYSIQLYVTCHSRVQLTMNELTTLMAIGTDYTGICRLTIRSRQWRLLYFFWSYTKTIHFL